MNKEYSNKSIVVIGGNSGIGRQICNDYINKGGIVWIIDKVFEESNDDNLKEDRFIKCDLKELDKLSECLAKIDSIDILIYSAGIFPDKEIMEMTNEDWQAVMSINLTSAFIAIRDCAKKMKENEVGHIVTISSGSYKMARKGSSHYCASKAGLVMLTKVAAQELAKYKIFVNSVAPGLIKNKLLSKDYEDGFIERIPMGRVGNPKDVSNVVHMLTSENNTYITGQVIPVDGGLSSGRFELGNSNK